MRKNNKIIFKEIQLPFKIRKPILAVGSQTKNTVCFAEDKFAFLSPVHSDLNCPEDFSRFDKDVKYFLKKNPEIIAYDLHPEYQSTKYINDLRFEPYGLRPIQHHHAHIAACMVENGLKNQKVIGVAFDGTGLGSDDRLWGAEFLICDYKNFSRSVHLKEIPLLGGERAILEPWRLAAFWLDLLGIDFAKGTNKKKWKILKQIQKKGLNSPLTSSAGRLFDAVASLVLAKYKANFEAELAIELERIAHSSNLIAQSYTFKIAKASDSYIIDPLPMFKEITKDLKKKERKQEIAYRFHLTVAEIIRKTCVLLRKKSNINKVVLSGGVFQNKLLLRLALDLLYKEDFEVFTHKVLSCNDSCISLGQCAVANSRS